MNFTRESGVLLHPTSLPGRYGMGELGPHAYRFAEVLQEMGQRLWQVLPLGPTGYGDSPYQSFSTFAGNTLLISFEPLIEEGLLSRKRLSRFPQFPNDAVNFGPVITARTSVLRTVCRSFERLASGEKKQALVAFCEKNADWLDDYALFSALKAMHNLRPWTAWEQELVHREPAALHAVRRRFKIAIRNEKICQFLFFDQWKRLVDYCHARNIRIIGDLPIFVAHDSADVWAHPELFYLDENKSPTIVAGVPPDYFSATGQLWGNPLYRWDAHQQTGYAWWVTRLRRMFELVDIVRIDHFRGFEAYWEIPGNETTAIQGQWVKGPNADLFNELKRQLGRLPIIAEDLGVITPAVERLRDRFEFPGMRILQFAFGNDDKADECRPESYPPNCVVYTGTHDNDTTVGWFHSEPGKNSTRSKEDIDKERRTILDYVKTDGHEIQWDMIGVAMKSKANTAIVPLQDILGLGSSARMNIPGTTGGNWRWRFTWDQLTPEMKARMRRLAEQTGRI